MKGSKFEWIDEADAGFHMMKERLATSPVLALPYFTHAFKLFIYASKVGTESILSQQGWLVMFFSDNLAWARLNYNIYDVEFYVVVQRIKHWRYYLIHQDFFLYTDHADHGHWVNFLDDFTFIVKHKTGAPIALRTHSIGITTFWLRCELRYQVLTPLVIYLRLTDIF